MKLFCGKNAELKLKLSNYQATNKKKGDSMKLFCGKNAELLGIQDMDGAWDMIEFKKHIESCEICLCGTGKIMEMINIEPRLVPANRDVE